MTYTHKESPMFSTKSWTDKIAPLYAWRKPTTDCIVHEDNLQQTYNGLVARLHTSNWIQYYAINSRRATIQDCV